MDAAPTRRHITHSLLQTAATLGLLRFALAGNALANTVRPLTECWAEDVVTLARDFRQRSLSPLQWQQAIAILNAKVPMDELLSYIDFNRLKAMLEAHGPGEHFERVRLPGLETGSARIWSAVFILSEGDAIPPHAHNNLATAHLVLQGRFHARTFDRVEDTPGRMLLKPSMDAVFGVGETVSMSDDRDNAHWFIAESGAPVFTFDVSMRSPELRQYQNPTDRDGRIFVAPADGRRQDGLVEAEVVDYSTSQNRFGKAANFLMYR
ncbi:hypothetical protein [Ferrovibrio terrae]|uniref:hypothetical protein n=1 Tax=Ferrovibrio terrae TaxID=2594003 RepID=UPI0031381DC8